MDRSITEKYSIVKSRAQGIKLPRVWFEWFLDLINAGWHRQYTFLGETYTFSSLSEFVEHKDGLDADPIAVYLATDSGIKYGAFEPYASQLMKVFHKEGFKPVIPVATPGMTEIEQLDRLESALSTSQIMNIRRRCNSFTQYLEELQAELMASNEAIEQLRLGFKK